jgi:membrane fusion protein (multidrug efflux system)
MKNQLNPISRKNKISMKINSIIVVLLTIILVACGAKSTEGGKAELDKLKKEKAALDSKIAKLEEEVNKNDTTASKGKVTEVTAVPLQPTIFKTYIEVQGRVDADESVALTVGSAGGTVTKIDVKVGDHVSKGQVLAETDVRALQQQLAASQTSVALATQSYERQKNLWDQKIGTEMQYLQAKTMKEAGESMVAGLQEQIRMSKIISPIDGTVDYMDLKLGQIVGPQKGVINVVNFSNMKVKADVAESYASKVKNNNEVLVIFPDMNDSVASKVHYASRGINPVTRTFPVEVLLDNKKEYHPNTVAKLKINDFQSPAPEIVLPVKYIQKGTNESYVMVAENGRAVKKVIKLGREYRGMAEVLEGLKAGDMLITEGYDLINEGDQVKLSK